MKKILAFWVFALLVVSSLGVLAQDDREGSDSTTDASGSSDETRVENEVKTPGLEIKTEVRERITDQGVERKVREEIRDEVQDKRQEIREEFKEKVEELRIKRREITEKQIQTAKERFEVAKQIREEKKQILEQRREELAQLKTLGEERRLEVIRSHLLDMVDVLISISKEVKAKVESSTSLTDQQATELILQIDARNEKLAEVRIKLETATTLLEVKEASTFIRENMGNIKRDIRAHIARLKAATADTTTEQPDEATENEATEGGEQ